MREVSLPNDWELKKISEIGEIISGGTPNTENENYWNGDIHWIVPTELADLESNYVESTRRTITEQGLKSSSANLLPAGTVLLTTRATVGECAITKIQLATNQGFQSIKCNDNDDNLFILYSIRHNKQKFVKLAQGTTFREISKNNVGKVELPFPKKKQERKKISSILASVDATLEQTKNIIKKNQRIKKGLMQKLLTESNHFTKVDNFLKINMGQSPPSDSYNKNRIGLPFLQGVTDFGEIYPNYITWCSNPKKIAGKNPILFSVRAPVGDINITKSKCCIGRGIASLDPGENDLFYCYYLLNQNKNRFLAFSKGTTYGAINKDEILCTELPFTKDKKKQQQIASILFSVDNKILTEKQNYEKLSKLQKGLMEDLLTPTLRVNI